MGEGGHFAHRQRGPPASYLLQAQPSPLPPFPSPRLLFRLYANWVWALVLGRPGPATPVGGAERGARRSTSPFCKVVRFANPGCRRESVWLESCAMGGAACPWRDRAARAERKVGSVRLFVRKVCFTKIIPFTSALLVASLPRRGPRRRSFGKMRKYFDMPDNILAG